MSASAVAVVVPVHDEEAHLDRCLAALDGARRAVDGHVEVHLAVVLDACGDASTEVARRWRRRWAHPGRFAVVESDAANVGAARRQGLATLLEDRRLRPHRRTWLASTDADSQVPPDWLSHQLGLNAAGHRAWGGTVVLDRGHRQLTGAQRAFWGRYLNAPDPHVHGASMGCDAEAYLAAGGFAALATGEDHHLHRALRAAGVAVHHDGGAPVRTSAREHGRAPDGFAADLRAARDAHRRRGAADALSGGTEAAPWPPIR